MSIDVELDKRRCGKHVSFLREELALKGRNLSKGLEVQKGVKNGGLEEVTGLRRIILESKGGVQDRGMRDGGGPKCVLRWEEGFDKVPKGTKEIDETQGSDEEVEDIETRLRARSTSNSENRWGRSPLTRREYLRSTHRNRRRMTTRWRDSICKRGGYVGLRDCEYVGKIKWGHNVEGLWTLRLENVHWSKIGVLTRCQKTCQEVIEVVN